MQPLARDELDLPVLRWVHTAEPNWGDLLQTDDLPRDGESCRLVPGLSVPQLDEALRTLHGLGLILGERHETSGLICWTRLRPTATGLRVLGEWPPHDAAALNDALARALRTISDDLPDDDRTALRRAASAVSKLPAGAVLDVAKEQLQNLGGDIAP
jgi:hypothetical protein